MKICVTGGAGYIGSHTCKMLAEQGHEVLVYDNLSTGHKRFVKWGDFEYGDIRDTQRFRQALSRFKPDGIIHFAAKAEVGESVADPCKYFSNNVAGTLSIIEAMRDEGVGSIVVSGTCAVYGQPKKVPISEDEPPKPINPYGASKLFMERMLQDAARAHNLGWISLRYFNAAGSCPNGETGELHNPESHLIPRVMMAALGETEAIDIFGSDYPTEDGTCIRDYIHVDDLARAHILAMEHLLAGKESMAINLGTGNGASVREIIEGVKEVSGKNVPVREKERRPGDPARLIADTTLAREALGWQARISLMDILTHAWNFFSIPENRKE